MVCIELWFLLRGKDLGIDLIYVFNLVVVLKIGWKGGFLIFCFVMMCFMFSGLYKYVFINENIIFMIVLVIKVSNIILSVFFIFFGIVKVVK